MRELFDDDPERGRLDDDTIDLEDEREVARVSKGVVAHGDEAAAGGVTALDDLHEVQIERGHDDARVRAVRAHSVQRLRLAVARRSRVRIGRDARFDARAPSPVRFDREQRREERHARHLEGRCVRVERVEPRVARVGGQRFVRQRRRHGGLGVGRKRRQPAPPGRLDMTRCGWLRRRSNILAALAPRRLVPIGCHQDSEPYHSQDLDRKAHVGAPPYSFLKSNRRFASPR